MQGAREPADGGCFEADGVTYAYLAVPLRSQAAAERLTAAERDVVSRVVQGASNAAIARARRTSARTVASQLRAIYGKLGVASRHELVCAVIDSRISTTP